MSAPDFRMETADGAIAERILLSLMTSTRGPGQAFATLVLAVKMLSDANAEMEGIQPPTDEEMAKEFGVAFASIRKVDDATN